MDKSSVKCEEVDWEHLLLEQETLCKDFWAKLGHDQDRNRVLPSDHVEMVSSFEEPDAVHFDSNAWMLQQQVQH